MRKDCKNCSVRKFYACTFDAHFDWRDCPYKCPVQKHLSEEERNRYIADHLEEHPEWRYEDREREREYEEEEE